FPLGVLRAMGSLNLSEEDRYKLFNRFLDDTVRSAISEMTSDDASRFEAKLTDVMLKYKNLEIVRFLFRVIFDLKQKDKLRECITNIGSFSGASLHPATFLPILALHSLPISAEKLSDFATRIRAKHGVWKHDLKLQALLQLIMSLDQAQERLPTSQIEAIIDHCLIGDLKKEGLKRVKLITAIAAIKPDALESIEAYESRALLDIVIVDLKKEGLIDEGIEDLSGKFAETFLASPVPEAILTYSALHYHDPSMKEAIRIFIGQVLEGTFIGFRNAHNSHAGVLSVDQKSIWESASTREVRITKEGAINLQAYLMTKLVIDKHGGEILRSEVLTEALEDLTLAEQAVSKLYKELGLSDEERLKLLDELEKELPGSCEFKNDVIALKRVLTDKSAIQGRIKDTDDPQDLFLSGTLVQGSCQRIDGDPGLNKCLMGYCLDGKIRMLALKDLNGKLKARAIVKLLIDHRKRPALYLERVYPADDPAIRKAFQEVLKEKAKAMGSKLYEGRGGEVLTSHGNRAPYEYEDGGVGISNGTYSIYAEEVAVK
ncbi:MAG: hypothetical protein K9M13_02690, partial [Simkaniaceae bacterium]|nr:hypothetical protein [Simkaniaceae bacterium]